MKIINLSDVQRKQIEKLWFIYGNNGKRHTRENHRFIQEILEGEDHRKFFKPTQKCRDAVDNILNSPAKAGERNDYV